MASSDKWRDMSNWRTARESAPSTTSAARNPRPAYQGRLAAQSWRTKEPAGGPSDASGQDDQRDQRDHRERPQRGDWGRGTRPYDRERANNKPQKDDSSASKAIAEGRRIYIGNLRYQAKPDDIEMLLNDNELASFESIHISIDHFTGRNPSYCFVEFPDRETAERAMSTLEGKLLLGREVKCRPCIPKGGASGGRQNAALDRWGRWSGDKDGRNGEDEPAAQQSPEAAEGDDLSSLNRYTKDFARQRLYVGGLPRMHDQATNFSEISELFKDFQIDAISKRITAHESVRSKPGHHDFCFVDFATPEQAQAAIDAINGTLFRGGRLKVNLANGRSNKWQERGNLHRKNNADKLIEQAA
ncbi:RNA-binding domain-containing protein [Hypoxylon sp. FL0543]|nr:RNA-binding domain-containing protein [Hypoxylon sp. FL0543]